jgi:peptidoglycan/LPS O-acetylase OafA/YrhL
MLGYWVAIDRQRVLQFVDAMSFRKKLWIFLIGVILVVFQRFLLPPTNVYRFDVYRPTIAAISFAAVIGVFLGSANKFQIRSRVLEYLGTISYGLYVFHIIVIHTTFQFCIKNAIIIDNWLVLSGYLIITFGLSVGLAALSYHYFEKPFLKLRERLTRKTNIPGQSIPN